MKYNLGWKDLNRVDVDEEKYPRLKAVLTFCLVIFFAYFLFVIASIAEIAQGIDVPYMPFWHEPLRRLLEFLNHLGLL